MNMIKVCCVEGCGKMYGCNIDGTEYSCRDCPFDLEACWIDYSPKPLESHGYCLKCFLTIYRNINRRKTFKKVEVERRHEKKDQEAEAG